jgi:hypothetical protein
MRVYLQQASGSAPTDQVLDKATQEKIRGLKVKALKTGDPAEQVEIYNEILELNPDDPVANARLPGAQDKVEKIKAGQAEKDKERRDAEQREHENETKKQGALERARQAFLAGDLKSASAAISVAKGLGSSDPKTQKLDSLIQKAIEDRQRVMYFLAGGGILVLSGLIALILVKRSKKEAYLVVVEGLEKGKKYKLDRDVIRIGAVPEYSEDKNDIVITDPGKAISRLHCAIERKNGRFYVFDCDSANGTWVDKQRAPLPGRGMPPQLKNGSRLKLAETCYLQLRFEKCKKA